MKKPIYQEIIEYCQSKGYGCLVRDDGNLIIYDGPEPIKYVTISELISCSTDSNGVVTRDGLLENIKSLLNL